MECPAQANLGPKGSRGQRGEGTVVQTGTGLVFYLFIYFF